MKNKSSTHLSEFKYFYHYFLKLTLPVFNKTCFFQATKADVMISLPGFTVSDAEEVKSRRFAFKVYHTGTMFYFAADNHEEMLAWMDCITVATRSQDSHSTCMSIDTCIRKIRYLKGNSYIFHRSK